MIKSISFPLEKDLTLREESEREFFFFKKKATSASNCQNSVLKTQDFSPMSFQIAEHMDSIFWVKYFHFPFELPLRLHPERKSVK